MSDQPHTKIITRTRDGTTEISVLDTVSGREHRTGMKVPASQADENCRQVAEIMKRAGNRVSHREV